MRRAGDFLRDKAPNLVAVFAATEEDKITFFAVCGKNAVEKGVKAGDLIKQVTAMTGGKDMLMLDNALAMVDNFVAMKLGLLKEDK